MSKTILTVMGTRPEAIKLAPIISALAGDSRLRSVVCSTGQHREMLQSVIDNFKIKIDFELDLMAHNQTINDITARSLEQLGRVLAQVKPDALIVQGDTTTAFAGALSAFYARIPVFHVEAGLRSRNILSPYPEEFNRRAISMIADLHFAPTQAALDNILREGVSANRVSLTGNSGIDTLFHTLKQSSAEAESVLHRHGLKANAFVLCTIHRRENFGQAIEAIFRDLNELAKTIPVLLPLHPNPNVRQAAERIFAKGRSKQLLLIEPVDYPAFVHLLNLCKFVITDSGGIQEEAATLGKPLIIMRDTTERAEAIDTGNATLCPPSTGRLLIESHRLLTDDAHFAKQSCSTRIFGHGNTTEKILRAIYERLELRP